MTDLQYAALAQAAYADFSTNPKNRTIETLLSAMDKDGKIADDALTELGDWTVIGYQPNTSSGFAGIAVQSPSGEIVFAFRGSEPSLFNEPLGAIRDFWADAQIAIDGLTTTVPTPLKTRDKGLFTK